MCGVITPRNCLLLLKLASELAPVSENTKQWVKIWCVTVTITLLLKLVLRAYDTSIFSCHHLWYSGQARQKFKSCFLLRQFPKTSASTCGECVWNDSCWITAPVRGIRKSPPGLEGVMLSEEAFPPLHLHLSLPCKIPILKHSMDFQYFSVWVLLCTLSRMWLNFHRFWVFLAFTLRFLFITDYIQYVYDPNELFPVRHRLQGFTQIPSAQQLPSG